MTPFEGQQVLGSGLAGRLMEHPTQIGQVGPWDDRCGYHSRVVHNCWVSPTIRIASFVDWKLEENLRFQGTPFVVNSKCLSVLRNQSLRLKVQERKSERE